MKTARINPKFRAFADKYLQCGNASHAARSVGYTLRSSGTAGYKLLRRPEVQEYLAQRAEQQSNSEETLQSRLISELDKMAFANIADFISIDDKGVPHVDLSNATREQLAAITNLKTKSRDIFDAKGNKVATQHERDINMADKYRGIELLGKTIGLFKADEQRVVVDVADRLLVARQRLRQLSDGDDDGISLPGGGGTGV